MNIFISQLFTETFGSEVVLQYFIVIMAYYTYLIAADKPRI